MPKYIWNPCCRRSPQPELRIVIVYEHDGPSDRSLLQVPAGSEIWSAKRLGRRGIVRELAAWKPDLVYSHGVSDPGLEAQLQRLAPSVLMAHAYYGTCISGTKACSAPITAPCSRVFGMSCLLHYFPKRCGGRNPFTMLQLYRQQRCRLRLLFNYRAVLTLSEHMGHEFVRHGLDPARVVRLPHPGFAEPMPDESNRRNPREAGRPWRCYSWAAWNDSRAVTS